MHLALIQICAMKLYEREAKNDFGAKDERFCENIS